MNITLTQSGAADSRSRWIDLRNSLNASITITVANSTGVFAIEGTDDAIKIQTELDTGVSQSVVFADITAMADTSGSMTLSAPGCVVVALFNAPAFVRVFYDRTAGTNDIQVYVTGRG